MAQENLLRILFLTLGTLFLLFGLVVIFIPLLPTTLLLLLSAAFYLRSSNRMYRWLFENRLFGEYLSNYKEGRGISLNAKLFSLSLLWLTISYSLFIVVDFWLVQILLIFIALTVSLHLILLPTYKKS